MQTLDELLKIDLDYICHNLADEFSVMAGKNVLMTGGAGFLGYYMVQSVLHWNKTSSGTPIHMTVFDNYARGVPTWLRELEGNPNLDLVRHDITDPFPRKTRPFSFVIHGAGIASPIYYRRRPIETMDANVNGLRHLLEYCRRQGDSIAGMIFYSSSEIYGDPPADMIPTPESYRGNVSCTGPRACYDESKRYGETLCVNFARHHGVPAKIVRPFNNYGPGLKINDRRVIPDFALDVIEDRDIVMLSDGTPTRTFCYSADAVCGYYKALVKGRTGEAYNIGVEKPEISMKELASKIVETAADLYNYSGKVVFKKSDEADYLADNPNRRSPDLTKSRQELGYNPSILVDEGLRRSLVWYHHNREGAEA